MQLERVQASETGTGWPERRRPARRSLAPCLLALLLGAGNGQAQDGDQDPGSSAASDGSSDHSLTGTWTLRTEVKGGDGNDRMAGRLSLEWLVRHWSGGLTLELENAMSDDAIHVEDGVGSFRIPDRWMAWTWGTQRPVELRLGTSRGVSFAEGLVLGSPTFDGLELVADVSPRVRLHALAGETDRLDPEDLFEDDEPFGLFPDEDDEDLGDDGRLLALRLEMRPRNDLLVGTSLVAARASDTPTARLLGADVAWSVGMLDLAAEVAARDGGGTAAFFRATVQPVEAYAVTVEGRRYSHFYSPLSSAPRYAGLSASDEHDETGAMVRFDFAPWRRVSGSVSTDFSEGGDKDALGSGLRRDHRLALRWQVTDRTTLAWGYEIEDVDRGRDGKTQSLLVTHSFVRWGRLSARVAADRASDDPRESVRVGWRCPLMQRRLTILVDARAEREIKGTTAELEVGASWRLDAASSITGRVTLSQHDSESVDITWYRRF